MRTFYYINGKRVSAETYFAKAEADEERRFMMNKCVEYYQNHPKEFLSYSELGDFFLMMHWEGTDDYKIAKHEFMKRQKRIKLFCFLFALFFVIILPIIVIILQDC